MYIGTSLDLITDVNIIGTTGLRECNRMGLVSFWSVLVMLTYWAKMFNTAKKNKALLGDSKKVCLEVNAKNQTGHR
jgi:hypothetical protein